MTIASFSKTVKLSEQTEVGKIKFLAYFFLKKEEKSSFTLDECAGWLIGLHFAKPNTSRLREKLATSSDFVQGPTKESFKLSKKTMETLDLDHPEMLEDQAVIHIGSIIPSSVYKPSREFIENLAAQINGAYENNIYDGCAVLMRRLMGILLILSFEHHGLGYEIKGGDNNYVMLERIIDKAKSNTTLSLSRDARDTVQSFRKLGNFSAHKIYYTCRKQDLQKVALEYRALFEELLYKSGLRI